MLNFSRNDAVPTSTMYPSRKPNPAKEEFIASPLKFDYTYIQPNLFPSYAQPALVLVNMRVFGLRLTFLGRLTRFFLLRLGRLLTQFTTCFARRRFVICLRPCDL